MGQGRNKLQNHRIIIIAVGKDLAQPPTYHHHAMPTISLRATSTCLLNTSRASGSTTCLFRCLTILPENLVCLCKFVWERDPICAFLYSSVFSLYHLKSRLCCYRRNSVLENSKAVLSANCCDCAQLDLFLDTT